MYTRQPESSTICVKRLQQRKAKDLFDVGEELNREGGRHSSMVLSAPTILWPRVQIPSTPSMRFQFVLLELYWEKNENKEKEAKIGPFLKKNLQQRHVIITLSEEAAILLATLLILDTRDETEPFNLYACSRYTLQLSIFSLLTV